MTDEVVELLTANITEILPANILDIDTKSVKCFLCDQAFVTGDESFLLFKERIQSDGSSECPLAQVLSSALDVDIDVSTAHSSLLCSACNDIVLEFECLEQKLFELRIRIITAYNRTTLKLQQLDEQEEIAQVEIIEKPSDDFNRNVSNVQEENTEDGIEDIIEEELSLVSNVFDSFEMIGETTGLQDNIKFFSADKHLSFDDKNKSMGIVIYEQQNPNDSEVVISEDYNNAITMVNDNSNSTETHTMQLMTEMDDTSQNCILIEGQNKHFLCSICDSTEYLDAKSFSQHMYNAHKLRVNICELCTSTFQSKQDLKNHIMEEHGTHLQAIKYKCEMRTHKRNMHSAISKLECQECHKKFNSKTSFEDHMNVHNGLRPFSCEHCPKTFTSKYSLHLHMKTHNDSRVRAHKCEECGKSFLTIQNLKHHKKIHNEKLFICDICQKTFKTQNNLDAHSIVHSGKRPFSCGTCGKTFARRPEVIDHERTHTGDRPFKCDICDMAFTQRSNLTAHKKTTHFNEKRHQCKICKRSFKRRRLLEYHIRAVHTGERPYKCETCGSSFVYPEHFKKHLRIHTGIKPYACEVCGKQFSSRDNRNAHRFIHSEKKPYECVECGAGFMRKPLLLAHMMQSKHANDTIIVNQPQISEGKVETATFAIQSDDLFLDESNVSDNNRNSPNAKNDDNCECVSFETILSSDTSNTLKSAIDAEEYTHSGHNKRRQNTREIHNVTYLLVDDVDAESQKEFIWPDLSVDKD